LQYISVANFKFRAKIRQATAANFPQRRLRVLRILIFARKLVTTPKMGVFDLVFCTYKRKPSDSKNISWQFAI